MLRGNRREGAVGQNVYSSLKFFHYPDRMQALAAGQHVGPLHVRIKPTNTCNHDCYFCAYRRGGLSLGSTMQARDRIPREKMREIVEDLIAIDVKAVTFSGGGEPLLYPYLGETLERLAAGGIKIGVLTNGAQLRGRIADILARTASWVRVSIDGWDDESYARYRKVPRTAFDRVLTNMAAFAAHQSDCVLGSSVIVDQDNASHLYELVANLKASGATHAKISPCILRESAASNATYHRSFKPVVRRQIDRCKVLVGATFSVVDHYHFERESSERERDSRCPMTRLLTVIGADCQVYACQDKAYTNSGRIGSIQDGGFRDLWYSGETQDWLTSFDARSCAHHCVAAGKNRLLNEFLDMDRAHTAFA